MVCIIDHEIRMDNQGPRNNIQQYSENLTTFARNQSLCKTEKQSNEIVNAFNNEQKHIDSSYEDLTVSSECNSGNNPGDTRRQSARKQNKYESFTRLSLSEINDESMLKRKLFEIIV
jgi:hypothetical protein